jgi:hypothetical protein
VWYIFFRKTRSAVLDEAPETFTINQSESLEKVRFSVTPCAYSAIAFGLVRTQYAGTSSLVLLFQIAVGCSR